MIDSGYGIQGIRERLELLQGQLTLSPQAQHGTRLTVSIPRQTVTLDGEGE